MRCVCSSVERPRQNADAPLQAITMLQQACADMHLVAARAVKTGFETREEDARGAPAMIDGSQ